MYHSKVTFWTAGIRPDYIQAWKKLSPLPRFEHEFRVLLDLSQIPSSGTQVIIFHASAPFSPKDIRASAGENGICILCGENYSCFLEEELSQMDDFWRGDDPPELAVIRFEKLQKRLKAEKDAWLCRNYLEQTIDTLPDLVWFKDLEGLHWKVNHAFCNTVSKTKEDIRGKDHYYIWGIPREEYEKTDFVCVQTEDAVIQARKTCLFDEEVMGKEGLRKLKTWKTPIFEEDGTIIGTVGIARDVTKEYEYQQTIIAMARYDALTSLANRRYMVEYVENEWSKERLAVVMMDLDYFKHVNDTYGHQTGDAALIIFSAVMKETFTGALNVRLGGDEFVMVSTVENNEKEVENRIAEFMEKLLGYYQLDPELQKLSVSAGITFSEKPGVPLDLLMHQADAALYQAKVAGRGCYYVYHADMEVKKEDAGIHLSEMI